MERNGVTHVLLDFLAAAARGDTSRQIWRIRGKSRFRLLHHDQIFFHCFSPACFITLYERSLVPDRRQSSPEP